MKAKKVYELLEDGSAVVTSLPKLMPKEEGETELDRADRIRKEAGIEVKEGAGFERGMDPKEAMGLGVIPRILRGLEDLDSRGYEKFNTAYAGETVHDSGSSNLYFDSFVWGAHQSGQPEIEDHFRNAFGDMLDIDSAYCRTGTCWFKIKRKYAYNFQEALGMFYKMNESEFERGKDPRHAMGIGAIKKMAKAWDRIQHTPGIGSMNITKADEEEGFDLEIWVSYMQGSAQRARDAVYKYMGKDIFSRDYLGGPHQYFRIKPEYEDLMKETFFEVYKDIPNLRIVEDGFDFERGQVDPFDKMGVGLVHRISRGLKSIRNNSHFGSLSLLQDIDPEWLDGSKMGIQFRMYISPDRALQEIHEAFGDLEPFGGYFSEGDDYAILTVKKQWMDVIRSAYKKFYGLKESQNFERGQDPKRAMGIGMERKLKPYSLSTVDELYGISELIIERLQKIFREKDTSKIYALGVKNDLMVSNHKILGKIEIMIDYPEDVSNYVGLKIYDTPEGKIVQEHLGQSVDEDEDFYFWGLRPLAMELKIWEGQTPEEMQ